MIQSVQPLCLKGTSQPRLEVPGDLVVKCQKRELRGRESLRDPSEEIVMLRKIFEDRLTTQEHYSVIVQAKIGAGFSQQRPRNYRLRITDSQARQSDQAFAV